MECIKCGGGTKVIDSRDSGLKTVDASKRRRHECVVCSHRVTTYEITEDILQELLNTRSKLELLSVLFDSKKITKDIKKSILNIKW